jgi:hypothetical protein
MFLQMLLRLLCGLFLHLPRHWLSCVCRLVVLLLVQQCGQWIVMEVVTTGEEGAKVQR